MEYAGFQKRDTRQVNWGQIGSDLIDSVTAIKDAKKSRDTEAQETYDAANQLITDQDLPKTVTIGDFVLKQSQAAREKISSEYERYKNREITLSEYNARVSNMTDSWKGFATGVNTYDERILASSQRQLPAEDGTPGPASEFEVWNNAKSAEFKNLSGKTMVWGEDGRMYFTDLGEDGLPDMSSAVDAKTIGNAENMVDNRVDVAQTVDGFVDKLGGWKVFTEGPMGSSLTIDDPRLNAQYENFKSNVKGALISKNNPRGVVSVLLDNSDGMGYELYRTKSDINRIMNEAFEDEEIRLGRALTDAEKAKITAEKSTRLIKVQPDGNGVNQPVVTQQMIEDAGTIVDDYIESMVKHEEAGKTKRAPTKSGGGSGEGSDSSEGVDSDKYARAFDGWATGDLDKIQDVMLDKYHLTWGPGEKGSGRDIIVSEKKWDSKNERWLELPIATVKYEDENMIGLAQYMYDTGKVKGMEITPQTQFKREKKAYWSSKKSDSGSGEPKGNTPKVGEVISGYEFLGGDPKKKENWKKV